MYIIHWSVYSAHVLHHCSLSCCTFHILVDGEPNSDNLEGWQIALIIVVPLVAVVIMLGIGIYCACRRKSRHLEGPKTNKDYAQVHHNQ